MSGSDIAVKLPEAGLVPVLPKLEVGKLPRDALVVFVGSSSSGVEEAMVRVQKAHGCADTGVVISSDPFSHVLTLARLPADRVICGDWDPARVAALIAARKSDPKIASTEQWVIVTEFSQRAEVMHRAIPLLGGERRAAQMGILISAFSICDIKWEMWPEVDWLVLADIMPSDMRRILGLGPWFPSVVAVATAISEAQEAGGMLAVDLRSAAPPQDYHQRLCLLSRFAPPIHSDRVAAPSPAAVAINSSSP